MEVGEGGREVGDSEQRKGVKGEEWRWKREGGRVGERG